MLLLLAILLSPAHEPARIEASLYVSAVAWGHSPAEFRGLAWCESKMQVNPHRYDNPKYPRWGNPPHGRRWNICGYMQLPNGGGGKGPAKRLPTCELQILFPSLAIWFGGAHLAGWKRACGKARQWDCYNQGGSGMTQGTWGECVHRRTKAAVRAAGRRR